MENGKAKDARFELEDPSDDVDKKEDGIYCSTGTLVFCGLVACCLIAGSGLIAYYVPDRTCAVNDPLGGSSPPPNPTTEKTVTEPPLSTTTGMTESTTTTMMPDTMPSTTVMKTTMGPSQDYRLNRYLMAPRSYDLTLQPCLYSECGKDMHFKFYGEVDIVVELYVDSTQVIMHSADLDIKTVEVYEVGGDGSNIYNSHAFDTDLEFLIIQMSEVKRGNNIRISIMYTGILQNGLAGFYRSSYRRSNGELVWLATSQMQPTDARRALPCWDEPGFRSYFDVKIIHLTNMTALGNGLETGPAKPHTGTWEREDSMGLWSETSFETTPKMPTYLLAFVVSDFAKVEGNTTNGVRFRVWCRPEAIETAKYALDQGIRILTYFEDYFNIEFPMPKQDMVAVPDFSAGAMENWGLIIYRETALLYDPEENSASNKQRVAVVVSHELAHQWFGNLVTLKWWDDLWLNEGFATYVEYLGVHHTEDDWQMPEQFVVGDLQYVFESDALTSSHPIKQPVSTPAQINEIFDSIAYSKGGSILRMLNNILGEDVFKTGLTRYLNHFSEGNAESDDLWDTLNQVQDTYDVKTIMDTWTLQMGYPVLTVTNRNGVTLDVSQKRFLNDPSSAGDAPESPFNYLWYNQITYAHQSSSDFENPPFSWMNGTATHTLQLEGGKDNDWYIFNTKQYNYYRVNYDLENWNKLSEQLNMNTEVFPTENRAALINDAFSLARAGELSYTVALAQTLYLQNETEYLPWEATLDAFSYIQDMFSRNPGYGALEKYMLCQINNLYETVGFEDDESDPHLDQYNRVNAISTACTYGNEDCLQNTVNQYAALMEDPVINKVSPNLRTSVYCNGIREGGIDEWDFGLERYQSTDNAAEKTKWLFALSCSREPWILSRYLNLALDDSIVRKQDSSYVIRYVSLNYVGRALAWDFVRGNYDDIFDYYGESSFTFARLISTIASHFNSEFDLEELMKFGDGREFGSATRSFTQTIERTKANIAWMEINADDVAVWLENNVKCSTK